MVKPKLLVCSSACTRNMARHEKMREANEHVSFVMDLCLLQRQSNSYFLYEHPDKMTSFHVKQVRRIQNLRGVEVTKVDQGIYGFMARGLGGEPVAACKLTKFVTNAPEVASEFKLVQQARLKEVQYLPRRSDLPFFDGLLGRPQKRRIPSFLEKMEDLVLCDKSSVFGATCLHLHKTAGNWKPETGNRKPETRNWKAETGTGTGSRTGTGT